MTQFLTKKETIFETLECFLKNNKPFFFLVSPKYSSFNNVPSIKENLENQILTFKKKNGLTFYLDGFPKIHFPLKHYYGFRIEYRDKKDFPFSCTYENPSNPHFSKTKKTVLRTVIDKYLLEIHFKGKIELGLDQKVGETDFWKIKK